MAVETQELDAEELLALAKHDVQKGELERALTKLKRLVSLKQVPPDALAVLGRLYGQLGLTERAQASFRRFLDSNPDAAHETFELGVTYFDQGNDAQALEHWTRSLVLQPTHPPTLFFSAVALSRTGKRAEARRQLDVLFKSAPGDNLYVERGRELMKTLDQEPAIAAAQPAGVNPYGGH